MCPSYQITHSTPLPFLLPQLSSELQPCVWCLAVWSSPMAGTQRWSGTCVERTRGGMLWATARCAGPTFWLSLASWTPSSCPSWPLCLEIGKATSCRRNLKLTTKVRNRNYLINNRVQRVLFLLFLLQGAEWNKKSHSSVFQYLVRRKLKKFAKKEKLPPQKFLSLCFIIGQY